MKAAILGYGFVGKATEKLLQEANFDIVIQDPLFELYIDDWTDVEYAFICVPTPTTKSGKLDTLIVHTAVASVPDDIQIVMRSTVGPDQLWSDWLFMPEFLREMHWAEDVADKTKPIIIGGPKAHELAEHMPAGRRIIRTSAREAAIFKMGRNAMLAAKVIMSNEIKQVCERHGVPYDNVRDMFINDRTLGTSHFDVPGPDGEAGYGGKCLPKDTEHFASLLPTSTFQTVVTQNRKYRK